MNKGGLSMGIEDPNPDIEKIDITNHGNLERFF